MKYFGPKLMCYYYRRTELKMIESLRIFRSLPDWLPEGKVGVDLWRPIDHPKKHNSPKREEEAANRLNSD